LCVAPAVQRRSSRLFLAYEIAFELSDTFSRRSGAVTVASRAIRHRSKSASFTPRFLTCDASFKLEGIEFLGQGTIYPDVIESAGSKTGKAHVTKSHHIVGGLPANMA
jgi:GMP synthase PP-ATPase subunit